MGCFFRLGSDFSIQFPKEKPSHVIDLDVFLFFYVCCIEGKRSR